jgi:hypothetical protein
MSASVSRIRNTQVPEDTFTSSRLESDYFLVPFMPMYPSEIIGDQKVVKPSVLLDADYKKRAPRHQFTPTELRNFRALARGDLVWLFKETYSQPHLRGTAQVVNAAQLNAYFFRCAYEFFMNYITSQKTEIQTAYMTGTGDEFPKKLNQIRLAMNVYNRKLRDQFMLLGVMTDNVTDDAKNNKMNFANQLMNITMQTENTSMINQWQDVKVNDSLWVHTFEKSWKLSDGSSRSILLGEEDASRYVYAGQHDNKLREFIDTTGAMDIAEVTGAGVFTYNEVQFYTGIGQVIQLKNNDISEEELMQKTSGGAKCIGICTLTNVHGDGSAKRAFGSIQSNLQVF